MIILTATTHKNTCFDSFLVALFFLSSFIKNLFLIRLLVFLLVLKNKVTTKNLVGLQKGMY
eukprot:m.68891 g.68891  ORF g.68891 m.68891 type:complete len:61 (+) comp24014_c0_seq1:425-607(+)